MTALQGWTNLVVPLNPIFVRGLRSRLRLKHFLSWGTITVTVTAFVSVLIYLTMTEREVSDAQTAAKAMVVPLIVIQGVILMLLGTGAVAAGVSHDRDKGLLDYHRMTPMSPTAKILGYVFGLPAREYFLFALTLPFLGFAVHKSGLPIRTVVHFYAVFFTSVWLYHLTGMVAGMLSQKPRLAALTSQGLVVLLYLILPQLSVFGLTFLEFLTVRPTLYGMVMQELHEIQPGLDTAARHSLPDIGRYEQVPFFNLILHPTTFTLLVQAFLLTSLFAIVHRKWCDIEAHAFSKLQGLFVYAVTSFFLVGSLWPILRSSEAFEAFLERNRDFMGTVEPRVILLVLLTAFVSLSGGVALLLLHLVTPTKYTAVKGYRRMRKLGLRRLHPSSDAVSSLPLVVAMIVIAGVGYLLLLRQAQLAGWFFAEPAPLLTQLEAPALFATIGLFLHAVRERFSGRIFFVVMFLLWMLPAFTAMVLFAAEDALILGTYVGLPCPIFPIVVTNAHMLDATLDQTGRTSMLLTEQLREHEQTMVLATLVFYGGLALLLEVHLWRWKSRLRRAVQEEPRAAA
jgi:hypothetical protein